MNYIDIFYTKQFIYLLIDLFFISEFIYINYIAIVILIIITYTSLTVFTGDKTFNF